MTRNDGLRVVVVKVDDTVVGLDGPDETHSPASVGIRILDESLRVVTLLIAVEAILAEDKRRRDRAVLVQFVSLYGVVRAFFEKSRNIGDHIPIAHKAIEIDVANSLHFGSFRRAARKEHG